MPMPEDGQTFAHTHTLKASSAAGPCPNLALNSSESVRTGRWCRRGDLGKWIDTNYYGRVV